MKRFYFSHDLGYGGVMTSVCPVFISSVSNRPALSAQLLSSDEILCWYDTVSQFTDFSQANKTLLFNINHDGYVIGDLSGVPAAIAAVLAAAVTYNVTRLVYNLEWSGHSVAEKITRLAAIRAELNTQGNTRPVIFCPIYSEFLSSHDSFAPYIEGYSVQLQNVNAGDEVVDAIDAVAKAHGAIPGCPVSVQIRAYSTGRTVSQVVSIARNVSRVSGITGISLFFGPPENWSFCQAVLNKIRKV
jgi:hypothetical protein